MLCFQQHNSYKQVMILLTMHDVLGNFRSCARNAGFFQLAGRRIIENRTWDIDRESFVKLGLQLESSLDITKFVAECWNPSPGIYFPGVEGTGLVGRAVDQVLSPFPRGSDSAYFHLVKVLQSAHKPEVFDSYVPALNLFFKSIESEADRLHQSVKYAGRFEQSFAA